jgi:hypothetical protein
VARVMLASMLGHTRQRALASLLALSIFSAAGCVAPLLPDPAVRYIAFGDSTTAGAAKVQYWQYVQRDLSLPAEAFANQGRGGETLQQGLPRLQGLLDRHIYPNAQVLFFWEGGDDVLKFVVDHDPQIALSPDDPSYPLKADLDAALDQVQADIEQAIALASESNLKVYVATYFDLLPGECKPAPLNVLLPEQAQRANQYVPLLNDRIRLAASNGSAVLVDVASQTGALASDPGNYANCNHLSDQGNRIVADVFLQAIQTASP